MGCRIFGPTPGTQAAGAAEVSREGRLFLGRVLSRGPSGGAPLVVAVETAGFLDLDDVAVVGSLDRARLGAVHGERAVVRPEIPVAAFDKHRTRAEEVDALMLQPEAERPAGTLLKAHLRPASRPRA